MFGKSKKKKKMQLEISDFERRLIVACFVEVRNKLKEECRPTEDVDDFLLRIC